MKRISSESTRFDKWVFPVLWFGFVAFVLVVVLGSGETASGSIRLALIPCALGVFGYFLMKKCVWDPVDEVYDAGDFLVVRSRGKELRIPLTDIKEVDWPTSD